MATQGAISGRARLGALLSAVLALVLATTLLSGPTPTQGQSNNGDTTALAPTTPTTPTTPPSTTTTTTAKKERNLLHSDTDPVGKDKPENTQATFGSAGSAPKTKSETDELTKFLRGKAETRLLSLATDSFETAGQRYLGDQFRIHSSLLWTEENRFSGELTFVVPLRDNQRSLTFLQPGIIAWNGNDIDGESDRRTDVSIGVVHRIRTGRSRFFGGSLFYDSGKYSHQRIGLGVDYQVVRTRLSSNFYLPISDSQVGFANRREYALQGVDFSIEQGIGDAFSASFTGGLWEPTDTNSEDRVGSSKSTLKGDIKYFLNEVVSLRGGYEWSDDYINTSDSYNFGIDFRFPATGASASRGFRADPWAPVKRESRILVARSQDAVARTPKRELSPDAVRNVVNIRTGTDGEPVYRPLATEDPHRISVDVELAEGPAVYYAVNWNAGSAQTGSEEDGVNDFDVSRVIDRDAASDLFRGEDQACIFVPETTNTIGIDLSIINKDNEPDEIIRIFLEPKANETDCTASTTPAGTAAAFYTVDVNTAGVIDIRIPLSPSANSGNANAFASFVAVDGTDNATLSDAAGGSARQTYTFFVANAANDALSDVASAAWPLEAGEAVGATVLFTSDDAIHGSAYTVVSTTGAPAVDRGGGRYDIDFSESNRTVSFVVELADGALVRETDATVTATVTGSAGIAATRVPGSGDTNSITFTLAPDPKIVFGDNAAATAAYTATHGENTEVRIPVTVNYLPAAATAFAVEAFNTAAADAARENDDYTFPTQSVTFTPDGEKTQHLVILTLADGLAEGDEKIDLQFVTPRSGLGGDYDNGNDEAALTITDGDPPPTLSIISAVTAPEGGRAAELTVNLSGPSDKDVTGSFATTPGNATLGNDYTDESGDFTVFAGETSGTFTVGLIDDDVHEGDETFTVTISSEDANINLSSSIVTIMDDETVPEMNMAASTLTVSESGGTANIFVNLSGESSRAATVSVTAAGGNATAGTDYTPPAGTFTINAGQTSAAIEIPIINDDPTSDDNETFDVTIAALDPGTVTVGSDATTTVTISELVIVILNLKDSDGRFIDEVSEADIGSGLDVTVEVALSSNLNAGETASVALTASGTGTLSSSTVSFNGSTAGDEGATPDTETTLNIPASADNATSAAAALTTLTATLTPPSSRATEFSTTAVTQVLAILNDDAMLTFTTDPSTPSISEDGSTTDVTVSLAHPVDRNLNVPVEVVLSGTARAGDFAEARQFVRFPKDTDADDEVTISAQDDDITEGEETFSVNLDTAGLTIAGAPPPAVTGGTIDDNDNAALSVTFEPEIPAIGAPVTFKGTLGGEVEVGAAGSISFDVTRTGGGVVASLIFSDRDGDGILSGRELSTDSTRAWIAEQGTGASPLVVGFSVALTTPAVTGTAESRIDSLPVTVNVGLSAVMVSFAEATAAVSESDGEARLVVNISPALPSNATATVAITSDTATADTDYTDTTTLTLPARASSVVLPIPLLDDDTIESDEVFVVTLSAPANAPFSVADGSETATVTLSDSDDDRAVVQFSLVAESETDAATAAEITSPASGQSLKLKATVYEDGNRTNRLDIAQDGGILVAFPDFPDAQWGTTAVPDSANRGGILIDSGASAGLSEAFNLAHPAAGTATIPAPTFSPDIQSFTSPADGVISEIITLPAPPEFNFIASETDTTERTWPFAVLGSAAVTQKIVLGLPEAPAADVVFTLSANTDGIPSGDAASSSVWGTLPTLTVPSGATFGTATLNINPASASGTDRFYLTAEGSPYVAGDAGSVEFVVSATASASSSIAFRPAAVTVARGGTTSFLVHNLMGRPASGGGEPMEDLAVVQAGISDLPTGVNFYFDTDSTSGSPDVSGGGFFSVPAPADGESIRVLVEAASNATLGAFNGPNGLYAGVQPGGAGTDSYFTVDERLTINVVAALPTIQFSAATFTVNENDGDASLGLTISDALAAATTLNVRVVADSAGRADYSAVSSFTLPAGETTATLAVPVTDDDLLEGDEEFTVTIMPSFGASYTIGATRTATVRIEDNDDTNAKLRLSLVRTDLGIATTSPALQQDLRIKAEIVDDKGTADTGDDTPLVLASPLLITPAAFPAAWGAATTAPAAFPIAAGASEGMSSVFVISGSRGETAEIPDPTFTAIGDFESPTDVTSPDITLPDLPGIGFAADSVTVSHTEGDSGTSTLTLNMVSEAPLSAAGTVTVAITSDRSAATFNASSADYTAVTSVTLAADTARHTLEIPVTGDTVVEGDEVFLVTLSAVNAASDPYRIGSANVATVTIRDNDTATLTAVPSPTSVSLGDTVTFTGTLSNDVEVG
ncbi:MAG: inverse autotransporter beta domain-containing protein, partial [Alphaproteobacteria bacterium]|nr:inverse autotransporter beta domain-containing protein [Alphaproteobacteria bacterium]